MVRNIGFFVIPGIDAGGPAGPGGESPASSCMASRTFWTKGRSSYSTLMSLSASSATCGLVAATAADRMTVVQDFAAGHNVRSQVPRVDKVLADLQHPRFNLRKVGAGNDRFEHLAGRAPRKFRWI